MFLSCHMIAVASGTMAVIYAALQQLVSHRLIQSDVSSVKSGVVSQISCSAPLTHNSAGHEAFDSSLR